MLSILASRPAASGAFFNYPAGTVLLETRLQNGEISYQEKDIVRWIDGWRPSDGQVTHLMEEFGLTPEATVVFIASGNGGVNYSVTRRSTEDRNGCSLLFRCLARCLLCVAHRLRLVCGWIMRAIGVR